MCVCVCVCVGSGLLLHCMSTRIDIKQWSVTEPEGNYFPFLPSQSYDDFIQKTKAELNKESGSKSAAEPQLNAAPSATGKSIPLPPHRYMIT